ncbi:hypothetical protein [Nostoc sp. CMAA1605]|uniref:hypothetical protein n=1 Tax=Nostoc sp. CMAA1605 TaxID=2055159 RepID=UPI001F2A9AAF|nr:hypothetical protein [Nostoc sp. CMAA1605]
MGTGDWGHFDKLSASLGIGDWGQGRQGRIYFSIYYSSNHSLLTTYHSPLITHHSALSTASVNNLYLFPIP